MAKPSATKSTSTSAKAMKAKGKEQHKATKAPKPSAVLKIPKDKSRKPKDPKQLAKDVNCACKKVRQGPCPQPSKLYQCPFRVKVREPYFATLRLALREWWEGKGCQAFA